MVNCATWHPVALKRNYIYIYICNVTTPAPLFPFLAPSGSEAAVAWSVHVCMCACIRCNAVPRRGCPVCRTNSHNKYYLLFLACSLLFNFPSSLTSFKLPGLQNSFSVILSHSVKKLLDNHLLSHIYTRIIKYAAIMIIPLINILRGTRRPQKYQFRGSSSQSWKTKLFQANYKAERFHQGKL